MIYSTYIDLQVEESCLAAGALVVLAKPVTMKGYNEMMDTFLESVKKSSGNNKANNQ